jgi:hypothetical protein
MQNQTQGTFRRASYSGSIQPLRPVPTARVASLIPPTARTNAAGSRPAISAAAAASIAIPTINPYARSKRSMNTTAGGSSASAEKRARYSHLVSVVVGKSATPQGTEETSLVTPSARRRRGRDRQFGCSLGVSDTANAGGEGTVRLGEEVPAPETDCTGTSASTTLPFLQRLLAEDDDDGDDDDEDLLGYVALSKR